MAKRQGKRSPGQVVRAPVAQNRSSRRSGVQLQKHSEKERIATVKGSVAFSSVANFAINPGIPATFPWLSGVAQHYERYRLDSLVVRYKNLKGTDTDGNIIMSFDPDTLDQGPTTAVIQTQSTVYVDGAPWRLFEMRVPCDRQTRFIRSGPVFGADLKTYDAGRIWVSAEGCADDSDHGYLELEYSVSLFEKQNLGAAAGAPACTSLIQFNLDADQTVLGGASDVLEITEAVLNNAALVNVAGVITLPVGTWEVGCEVTAFGLVNPGISVLLSLNVDGAIMSPAVYSGIDGLQNKPHMFSLTGVVVSDGSTTCSVVYTNNGNTSTALADH